MASYYCLMASLPELNLSDAQPKYSIDALREEAEGELTADDKALLETYFFAPREGEAMGDEELYAFMQTAQKAPNATVRGWWTLQLGINNYLTAQLARRAGWNPSDYVQGEGEMQEMIGQHASAKDFELSKVWDVVPRLTAIADESDPVRKEQMIDALKWEWLSEAEAQDMFCVDALFAYLCKLEIQERWAKLDPKQGEETFKRIIDDLRGEARVPEEFIRK